MLMTQVGSLTVVRDYDNQEYENSKSLRGLGKEIK